MKKFFKLTIIFFTLGLSFVSTPAHASLGLPSGPVGTGK